MSEHPQGASRLGIVFDLDGTLIHSTIDFVLMRDRVFRYLSDLGLGQELNRNETIAKNMERVRSEITTVLDLQEIERMVDAICAGVEMMHVHRTKEVAGAGDALRALRAQGYQMALLTRGSRDYAVEALHASNLTGLLDAMVCRDDHEVSKAKPHPEALSRAAAALHLRPERCVMIGDHMMDLECARSAGSMFVAVLSGNNGLKGWEDLGVNRIIASIAELPSYLQKLE